ncbi:hypothetical protein HPB52_005552 [Rhipicephalus sanguineus]|uniref:26S proteasome regulatory subunit RPN11 C-terminal domain-containing protein n=1 Tax=Rhipicephalus sanguineus TaxID=34632 RepID=A0A9D4Q7D3_RHISA|nr:hypothetical protein HPB52_005552 [Rhipicephalus sanguineus]
MAQPLMPGENGDMIMRLRGTKTRGSGRCGEEGKEALIHGLNRHYYSISINYRKNELEQKSLEDEEKMTPEQLAIKNVGKQDPKRHLEERVDVLMTSNIVQCLGAMLDTVVFK